MIPPPIEPIHGNPFALRIDGAGHDPVDNTYAEGWVTVLQVIGEDYLPLRRFPDREGNRASESARPKEAA